MAFAIRRLGIGDESVLTSLAAEAPEFDLAGRSTPQRPLTADRASAYLADASVLHWIAEEDGRVVGELLCHLLPLPYRDGLELLLYSVGVRAGARRRGVGTALVREMLRWMEREDVPEAWVLADNPGAEAFYAAWGFERGVENEQGVLMMLNRSARGDATA
jgi:GNAT superfamily N-acetyltransferase